ncbi:MBL fold metallo-hydrolase [Paenibacillus abyssi]|uniref:Metallo-beta-lactamase domain-containing protein n=1 Tax=Paenibacillus abyssi TaxID=1340531 RepID=A0A917FPB3_9BACL|nr:MBL fold metallo-hydrolase [Paenibacillus abyssi]GGF92492.1 hypothetical protein GCM10010916_07350 [Paenibacillus abyssi]
MKRYHYPGVEVFQSALFQTNATIVETDDLLLLVDPTWLPHEITEIKEYVKAARGQRQLYLLFTHSDFDHLIGYSAFQDAVTIGSRALAEETDKQRKLDQIHAFDAEYYIERDVPVAYPAIDHVIERDGQILTIGQTKLTFYLAPGHTACGVFTLVEPTGVWLAGDYLSDFELPLIEHSAAAYEETLGKAQRMISLHQVGSLVPGHGAPTGDTEEMERRIAMASEHLQQLRQAVRDGDEQALVRLEAQHAFPSAFTREGHLGNIRMIREEEQGLESQE